MEYILRKAEPTDTPTIISLVEQSVKAVGRIDYTDAQIEGALVFAWGVDTQLIEDETYFVVEDGGELIACGGWRYRQTLFGNDQEAERRSKELDRLTDADKIRAFFVRPSHARKGIGSKIMAHCEEDAFSMGFKRLELMATLPGQRFYTAHGFIPGNPIDYPLDGGMTIAFIPMTKALIHKRENKTMNSDFKKS